MCSNWNDGKLVALNVLLCTRVCNSLLCLFRCSLFIVVGVCAFLLVRVFFFLSRLVPLDLTWELMVAHISKRLRILISYKKTDEECIAKTWNTQTRTHTQYETVVIADFNDLMNETNLLRMTCAHIHARENKLAILCWNVSAMDYAKF